MKNDEMEAMILETDVVFSNPQIQNVEHNRGEADAKRNFICATLRMRYV